MKHKTYNYYVEHLDDVYAEAYLTLPLLHAPISSDPGCGVACFSVSSVLNPSALVGPTEDQLRKFKLAANTLELHVYNPDEKYTRLDDQPFLGESLGDSESGESMDGEDKGNGAKSYSTDSQTLTSDGALLQVQVTAENTSGGSKFYAVAPEPTTEQADRETRMDVDPEEIGAFLPLLMIFGRGDLEK